MLFGLSGSAGTGKTTLAKAVAEELSIEYLDASVTGITKKHGFNAVLPMTIEMRLQMQLKLLQDHVTMVTAAPRPLIVDRTPLDMAAYMLAEITMNPAKPMSLATSLAVKDYVDTCIALTKRLYDTIVFIAPLPNYEEANTRPSLNPAYHIHSQLIMQGLGLEIHGVVNYQLIRTPNFDARCEILHDTIVKRLDEIQILKQSTAHIH